MGSPPKPWERNGAAVAANGAPTLPTASATTAPTASSAMSAPAPASTSSSQPPAVPERPSSLSQPSTSLSSPYSYGSSPYSRLGGAYGGSYGGYGGYGGLGGMGGYGGMGMGYNAMGMGYGGMGMGYGGMGYGAGGPFDPMNGPTLTQTLEATTQQTFGLLHSIVQTFSGVAQMLESTFMATHSSFFAMVGVVDQFGQLRNALGSVLGLFGLVRWMKDVLTGKRHPSYEQSAMQQEFRQFINGRPVQGPLAPPAPRPSKKPIIVFLLAAIGIPFAMAKLVRILNERAQKNALPPLDPSSLTFARALYPFSASNANELSLKENEIVAILGKLDPRSGQEVDPRMEIPGEGDWWKGRTRDGREGWFPRKWVEVLQKRQPTPVEAKKVD